MHAHTGGNAGLAAAYCARELGLPITVVVPQSTPEFMVQKLKEEGAEVEVMGRVRGGRGGGRGKGERGRKWRPWEG